jgi:FlaA1/EpsC-like NDP-sugar epimerase
MFTGGKMRILVTGGVGFIGSNFIHYLGGLDLKNVEIIVLDKLTYAADLRNLDGLEENSFELVVGDICDKELVSRIFPGTDYVIHFAAESHVDNSIASPDEFITTNIIGTQNVADVCLASKVEKAILISTDKAVAPENLYGATKLCAEKIFTNSNNVKGIRKIHFRDNIVTSARELSDSLNHPSLGVSVRSWTAVHEKNVDREFSLDKYPNGAVD